MSDFLLPSDFEVNLPRSPFALGQWLLKNGVTEEIVNVLKGRLACFGAIDLKTMAVLGSLRSFP